MTVTGTYYTLNTNETVGDDDEVYLPTESINETSILNLLNEGESVFSLTNSLSGYPYFTWITSPPFGTFGTTHDLTVININQRDLSSSVLFSLTLGEEDEEDEELEQILLSNRQNQLNILNNVVGGLNAGQEDVLMVRLDQITADIENSNSLLDSEKSPTLITGYRNINRSEDLVYIFYTTSKIAGLF